MSGGSNRGTQTILRDSPSAEQTALTNKQIELAEFQLEQLRKQVSLQEEAFDKLDPLVNAQLDDFEAARERAERLRPIEDEILDLQLERLRNGDRATDEQKALIKSAADSALEVGESDIDDFSGRSLEQLREELAPALGLRPGDSPILDRGARVQREAVRQQGQLARDLRSAQANAELNFPLAAGQLELARSNFNAGLTQAAQNFQANLRQAAISNRLNLANSVTGAGLGLAIAGRANLAGTIAALNSSRTTRISMNSARTPSFGEILSGTGKLVGGVGSALIGVGGVASASSKALKTDKTGIDPAAILAAVQSLPVEQWRYIGLDDLHIGPYAEDFRDLFGLGDGETINLMDAVGILFAAVKALADQANTSGESEESDSGIPHASSGTRPRTARFAGSPDSTARFDSRHNRKAA